MHTAIVTTLIVIGIVSVTALLIGLFLYFVAAPVILAHSEPAADSNEALRNWLLCNPDKTIDDYLK